MRAIKEYKNCVGTSETLALAGNKFLILFCFGSLVVFIIAVASGYTNITDCDYYRLGRTSLIPILIISLLSFLSALLLKMKKDARYIFVVVITMISFFTMVYFYGKKYNEILAIEQTTVTKAEIYYIVKNQFSTSLQVKTNPKKFKATINLKKKSDIGNLKVGDTILIKYVTSCDNIIGFHNLSPTKEELNMFKN